VEAAMKYVDPSVTISHEFLVEEYMKTKEFKSISYTNLKEAVLVPLFGSKFCFDIEAHHEFEEWKLAVQKHVLSGFPPLISIQAGTNFHMNAALGFTDLLFNIYDPASGCKPVLIQRFRGNHQPDMLTIRPRTQIVPSSRPST
jgi:hypothetical protein